MSLTAQVQRVVDILKEAGYRQVAVPLKIASVPFDFAAVMLGTGRAADLVVVIDTVLDAETRARQKIDALGRAMDVAGSRRPITAILAGPRPRDSTLDAIGRVCRVLPIGVYPGADEDQSLFEWLAVLLPLQLPQLDDRTADAAEELKTHIPVASDRRIVNELLAAAPHGSAAVRESLRQLVQRPLNRNDSEGP
jgi:hypothetical protein